MHATATATAGAGRDAEARALSRRGRGRACAPRRRHLYVAASLPPVHDRPRPSAKGCQSLAIARWLRPAAHAMHALSYVAGRLEICARLAWPWPWPSPTQSLHCSPGLLCSCCPVALLGELIGETTCLCCGYRTYQKRSSPFPLPSEASQFFPPGEDDEALLTTTTVLL
jgi:hypothetical protein